MHTPFHQMYHISKYENDILRNEKLWKFIKQCLKYQMSIFQYHFLVVVPRSTKIKFQIYRHVTERGVGKKKTPPPQSRNDFAHSKLARLARLDSV